MLTAWRIGSLVAALALPLWAGALIADDVRLDRASWQEKYRRPAEIPFPSDNPYSEAKSKLGRMLFFDPILSGSQDAVLRDLPQPGAVLGGRPAARDR